MAELSAFGIQGRGHNDITPVQAPVVDQSGGIMESAIAGVLNTAGDAFSTTMKIKAKGDKNEALEEATALSNESLDGLRDDAKALAQGADPRKVAVLREKRRDSLTSRGYSVDSQVGDMKKVKGLPEFDPLFEQSVQKQAEVARTKKYTASGVVLPTMSDEEAEEAMRGADSFAAVVQANSAQMAGLRSELLKEGLTKEQREVTKSQIAQKSFESVGAAVSEYRPQVKNTIQDLLVRMGQGEFSPEDTISLLQDKLGDLNANLANLGRGGDLAQIKSMTSPLVELYTRAINDVSKVPASALAKLTEANRLIEEKAKFNLLSKPELAEAAGISTIFGHSPVAAAYMSNIVATHLKKNSTTGDRPADLTGDKTEQKEIGNYLKGLTEGIGVQGEVNFDGSPMVSPEELFTNVEQTLNGASRYIRPEDPASETKALVEWMANPEVGTYLKTNMGKFDSGARLKLGDTLLSAGEQQIFPEVQTLLRNAFTDKPAKQRGRSGGSRAVTMPEIDLVVQGDQVVFKANTANGRLFAQGLNKNASKALTMYLRAVSNVSGTDLSTVLEENMAGIWPAKAVAEEGAVGEGKGETSNAGVELSPEEAQDVTRLTAGQEITDAEGNRFRSDGNGGFTQIRDFTNATSR